MNRLLITMSYCLCCAAATLAQSPGISLDLTRYPNIRNVEEVVQRWDRRQHLYVKGELGVGAAQLDALETWLDENGANWTVVLMRNARGESYQSLDRRQYSGMDAVEFALGRGLGLRTGFNELIDQRTGETNGAVFVLFLEERKFSYYSSVAQDVRRLGQSHWVGKLDRPAFRAMRGGGRILNAVKDTVSSINQQLTKRIEAEIEQAEREAKAQQRALLNVNADIESLRQSVQLVDQKAATLSDVLKDSTGELVSPPTETWGRQIEELAGNSTVDNVTATRSGFEQLSQEVEGFLNVYAEYNVFDANVAALEADIKRLGDRGPAAEMAQEANRLLAEAQASRNDAQRGLGIRLGKVRDAVAAGKAAVAEEAERLRRAEAQKKLIRRTVLATAALLSVVFLGVLIWLNRRRVPALQRAESALAEREKMVLAEMDKVYELFDRSGEILGDKEKVKRRGYEGTTKKLTGNAFEDVDDLFVMSTEVERVMSEAREMIRPNKIAGKIANLVSSSRFEQGVNRISGEPLEFHRDKGLPLVIQRESERTGDEPPESVTMTFDKVFDAFHERTATAEDTLNTIENSLLQVDDDLRALQEQIETTTDLDRQLADQADDDGFFELPILFEKLIPSAQGDFDQADSIAATDPVQAIQVQIPRGARKMGDALNVIKSVKYGRKEVFPILNKVAPQLKAMDYDTEWITRRVYSLGEEANAVLQRAMEQSAQEQADQFSVDVVQFGERVQRSVDLASELEQVAEPAIADLDSKTQETRSEIAKKLGISDQAALQEREANPDGNLKATRQQLAAAKAALQHGEVKAAEIAQANLAHEVANGLQILRRSQQILHDFDSMLRSRQQQHDKVSDKLPRHQHLLDEMQKDYSPEALKLQASDATYEDPSASVGSHLDQIRDALNDASQLVEQSGGKYRQGGLLEAEHLLVLSDQHCQEADTLLAEIADHAAQLQSVSQANEGKLAEMQRNVELQERDVDDARTMRPTITMYRQLLRDLELADREIRNATPRNPFRDAHEIGRFSEAVRDLATQIEVDHEAHAEAARAVAGAQEKRRVAEQLVNQARHDGIPDSPATTRGIQDVHAHDHELKAVESELNGQHNDWKGVDQTAARIHGELAVKVGRLRGELQRAQQLVAVFQTASDSVFEATRWTGGFGTRIFGSPGSRELDRARQALNAGDYSAMAELARAAQIAAQHAIQKARREVYRREREEARKAEAARRRRRSNSMHIGGGSGKSGGISFPSGGGSRGRSSSSSSGSGFSRSGW